ncbi:MAG: hypothetical protein HN736_16365 [Anaerolineae bacterium]|jgi:hypothetical protein|nr:hypothetical protein [Anaerolineae bacterium]MBT3713486.1 hypothetical protein [Anaerolineae bacterium]MBT4312098.1 hypothetical protein [Anaerolineae bacterium]MBT4457149.1 hypothetical protein [Anaerolineae bacterium]MBT4843094.1 hypothetical protein [Anaerolineae bacterium]
MKESNIQLLKLLARRLERLNVDSLWARRASGTRGNIIKIVSEIEKGKEIDATRLAPLIKRAFEVLEHAAQEIPDIDEVKKKYNIKHLNE